VFLGFIWLVFISKHIKQIQDIPLSKWAIVKDIVATEDTEQNNTMENKALKNHNKNDDKKEKSEEEKLLEERMKITTSIEAVNDI
jgi:hypothetical protein